jgi:hypothetical protein
MEQESVYNSSKKGTKTSHDSFVLWFYKMTVHDICASFVYLYRTNNEKYFYIPTMLHNPNIGTSKPFLCLPITA